MRRTFGAACALCAAAICFILLRYTAITDMPLQPFMSRLQAAATMTLSTRPSLQEERQHRLRAACANNTDRYIAERTPFEDLRDLLVDLNHNLFLCPIPKTSSSTMKRIFSVLSNKNNGKSIFNISGRFIHRHPNEFDNIERIFAKETFVRKHYAVNKARKVIFVRDPYEKLFSAYIDRVFGVADELKSLVKVISPQRGRGAKGSLSFTDIVNYMTGRSITKVDQHYRPSYSHCFPCHVQYDFIGKFETWREDAEAMLASVGVDPKSVLGEQTGFKEENELSILRDIVARAFEMLRKGFLKCFTRYELLKRTWISFQVRGFLPVEIQFPLTPKQAENVTLTQFDALVKDTYNKVKDRESVRRQKQLALREAFYSLPRPLLLKVQALLQPDCDIFGYECSVDVRFNESQRHKPVFHLDTL